MIARSWTRLTSINKVNGQDFRNQVVMVYSEFDSYDTTKNI